MIRLNVNGTDQSVDAEPDTPLLYVLRDQLGLNGAKYGCGLGQCGACTVIVDREPVFACLLPVVALQDRNVTTIEALGTTDKPNALQLAFIHEQAAQCGYCIAGMVMRAQALLDRNSTPTDAEIRAWMEPNLCRCGTHLRILKAIRRASDALKAAAAPSQEASR